MSIHFRRSFVFTILLLALSASFNSACAGIFSGRILDINSGYPIPCAEVLIGNGFPSTAAVVSCDSTGYYVSPTLPDLTDYTLLASAPGYESTTLLMQTPHANANIYIAKPDSGFLVETLNQGLVLYQLSNGISARLDGEVTAFDFPNIDANNALIDSLLASIGTSSEPTEIDSVIWQKCSLVWDWLQTNARYINNYPGDPAVQAAWSFMMNYDDGYPSIEAIAATFDIYGFIVWGTWMSRAHILTTMLYKVGLSSDRVAIAETHWQMRYSQHMFSVIWLANRWLYLDPSSIGASFPPFTEFRSVPTGSVGYMDYCHPYELMVIPGSTLTSVPDVMNRIQNSNNAVIVSPPQRSQSLAESIAVTGVCGDPSITEVKLNGANIPVIDGIFTGNASLSIGTNLVIVEVKDSGIPFRDTVIVTRIKSDCDGDDTFDPDDNCPIVFNPTQPDENGDGIGDHCDGNVHCYQNYPPSALRGENYFYKMIAIGGAPPFNWQLLSDSVPTGCKFNAGALGTITGLPTQNGSFQFTVAVFDAQSPQRSDTVSLEISVSNPTFVCGDGDGNSIVTISDAVYLINYIFAGGPAPDPLFAGDVDCNAIVTISDVVYIINYIFAAGPAPCAACP